MACVLQQLCESNDSASSEAQPIARGIQSRFSASKLPSITIYDYLVRIFTYAECSPACFILAIIYLDKVILKQDRGLIVNSHTIHRLLITSIMLAAKFLDDRFLSNLHYASMGGIAPAELNQLEVDLLFYMEFSLLVSGKTFLNYRQELLRHAALHMNRPSPRPGAGSCPTRCPISPPKQSSFSSTSQSSSADSNVAPSVPLQESATPSELSPTSNMSPSSTQSDSSSPMAEDCPSTPSRPVDSSETGTPEPVARSEDFNRPSDTDIDPTRATPNSTSKRQRKKRKRVRRRRASSSIVMRDSEFDASAAAAVVAQAVAKSNVDLIQEEGDDCVMVEDSQPESPISIVAHASSSTSSSNTPVKVSSSSPCKSPSLSVATDKARTAAVPDDPYISCSAISCISSSSSVVSTSTAEGSGDHGTFPLPEQLKNAPGVETSPSWVTAVPSTSGTFVPLRSGRVSTVDRMAGMQISSNPTSPNLSSIPAVSRTCSSPPSSQDEDSWSKHQESSPGIQVVADGQTLRSVSDTSRRSSFSSVESNYEENGKIVANRSLQELQSTKKLDELAMLAARARPGESAAVWSNLSKGYLSHSQPFIAQDIGGNGVWKVHQTNHQQRPQHPHRDHAQQQEPWFVPGTSHTPTPIGFDSAYGGVHTEGVAGRTASDDAVELGDILQDKAGLHVEVPIGDSIVKTNGHARPHSSRNRDRQKDSPPQMQAALSGRGRGGLPLLSRSVSNIVRPPSGANIAAIADSDHRDLERKPAEDPFSDGRSDNMTYAPATVGLHVRRSSRRVGPYQDTSRNIRRSISHPDLKVAMHNDSALESDNTVQTRKTTPRKRGRGGMSRGSLKFKSQPNLARIVASEGPQT
eukprot:gb/GEZN01001795.1/.p1 GENE.gb/GEZN01001795.1/~~gb/GEZN01001795.1/.p1  ORF type:complete len:904 (-),score=102.37 gb/GEZN01001795.1/:113-2698(-)